MTSAHGLTNHCLRLLLLWSYCMGELACTSGFYLVWLFYSAVAFSARLHAVHHRSAVSALPDNRSAIIDVVARLAESSPTQLGCQAMRYKRQDREVV